MNEPYDQDEYPPLELLEFVAEMELYANGMSDELCITIALIEAGRVMSR
jgi:hypothetical protein